MAEDYSLSDFVTPGQVKAQRDMAEALLKQSLNPPVGRVGEAVSPFAIGTQMAEALAGKYIQNRAGAQEKSMSEGMLAPPPGAPAASGMLGEGESTGAVADTGSAGNLVESVLKPRVASLESQGKYDALGPWVHTAYGTDRAYGKYQVMGNNIPQWTQEFLGHRMTPQQFLADQNAQEKVASAKLGQYLQQTGSPRDAASMWFSGRPAAKSKDLRAHDLQGHPIGISGAQYASNFPATMPDAPQTATDGQALAFTGEAAPSAGSTPDAPQAVSEALAGGATDEAPIQVAQNVAAAGGRPAPAAGAGGPATRVPSGGPPRGAFPSRQFVTRGQALQAAAILRTNPADPVANYIISSYYSQFQPQQFETPFGTWTRPFQGQPFFVPGKPMDLTPSGPEGIKPTPQFGVYGPGGEIHQLPMAPTAPGGTPAAPEEPEGPAPSLGPHSEATRKVKTASLEPTAGFQEAARGPLTEAPPKVEGAVPASPAEGPPTQVAQSGPMSIQDLMKLGVEYTGAKHLTNKNIDESMKGNQEIQKVAIQSANNKSYVDIADKLLQDPRLKSMLGAGANLKKDWSTVLAFLGNEDANAALGLRQFFDKNISSNIIGSLKSDYGGLGQIRNKEIELSEKATFSPTNTVEANLALLDIAKKTIERHQKVADIANRYMNGQRWDEEGNPIKGKSGDMTYAGLSGVINKYLQNHPIYDDKVKDADGKTELDRHLDLFKGSEKTQAKKRKEGELPAGGKRGDVSSPPSATLPPAAAPKKGLATHELPPGGSFH